jgi:predicted alpha/beta hydrolase family esterase
MPKTLILPGLDGSPAPHWQQWWAAMDPTALIVEQHDWSNPTHEAWEAELAGAILNHPGCILVGHSLGAVLAARILTRWPQLKVSAALLVAPANPDCNNRLASFAGLPDRQLGVPATLVASRNDPWMSFAHSNHLANIWGADFVDLGFAGHINVASGFGPWPAALTLRDDLAAQAGLPILRRTGVEDRRAIA